MKNIGIITIVKVGNYGAELQAFALQRKLEILGFKSEIIDYLYYKNWRYKDCTDSESLIPLTRKEKILYWIKYRFINYLLENILCVFNISIKQRIENFKKFHKTNTKFSKEFNSITSLYKHKFDYDAYIVGSDQVWNPMTSSSIEPYFLTFAPKHALKISYASSFGIAHIKSNLQVRMGELLNNIDAISVRENSGIDLVKQLTKRNAELVVDPTLLLKKEDWTTYMKTYPNMPSKYILIYQLAESKAIVDLAQKLSHDNGLPIYRICKRAFKVEHNRGIINILDAGPAEFLSLVAKATYMITNSFHGTAFSINFNIPFFTLISAKKKNNSRIESLLNMLDLENRRILDTSKIEDINITNSINYQEVMIKLEQVRNKSIEFLTTSLSQ